MDDHFGEWVESMGVASGRGYPDVGVVEIYCREWVESMGVASGHG